MLYPGERHAKAATGNKGNLTARIVGGDIVINGQSSAWVSNGAVAQVAILTIVGIACFTYLACWQASKNAPLSALLATGWVVMSQGIWTQVSHHWFTTLFSMLAAWAAMTRWSRPSAPRPCCASWACGTPSWSTPNMARATAAAP